MTNPKKKAVLVYFFENQDDYSYYSFRDKKPVAIYGGELVINLSVIDDTVSGWM